MKFWILMIFAVAQPARRMIERINEKIEKIALNPFGVTMKQYEKIEALVDKKSALSNLIVMQERVSSVISRDEAVALQFYSAGRTAKEIGQVKGESPAVVYGKIRSAICKGAKMLEKDGYTQERLEREYLGIAEIKSAYDRVKSQRRKAPTKNCALVF